MLSTDPTSFHAQYQALVSSGAIEADPAQADAAEAFAALDAGCGNQVRLPPEVLAQFRGEVESLPVYASARNAPHEELSRAC